MRLIAFLVLWLAGCTSVSTIYLENPETKEIVECQARTSAGDAAGFGYPYLSLNQQRECVDDYIRQGFKRVPGPVATAR